MKTSELSGVALDWAVAKAAGRTLRYMPLGLESGHGWWVQEETPNDEGGSVYMPVGPYAQVPFSIVVDYLNEQEKL